VTCPRSLNIYTRRWWRVYRICTNENIPARKEIQNSPILARELRGKTAPLRARNERENLPHRAREMREKIAPSARANEREKSPTRAWNEIYIYIYMYMRVRARCVCVCVVVVGGRGGDICILREGAGWPWEDGGAGAYLGRENVSFLPCRWLNCVTKLLQKSREYVAVVVGTGVLRPRRRCEEEVCNR
jgi:hypothetical protein